jgi:hypothetical protein
VDILPLLLNFVLNTDLTCFLRNFGPRRDEVTQKSIRLLNGNFMMYFSPYFIRMIKLRNMEGRKTKKAWEGIN